jgi:small subunit ribosomal protein S30e
MGKVHGSLTRAGKVRKQTPKVEKADKLKKNKVGRAKKRQQYKKKFAILVADNADARKRYKPNKQQLS